ncbi:hypothetical protein L0337_42475 [candidate division KSB1 bacterium]|nr:hypothetical protein [candidate division KSB1 bacterium]
MPAQPLIAPTTFAPVNSRVTDERALAPTIRVNIGRIEVRAITQPSAQPRPKRTRSGPALSLEDYLKQRNGRQR